MDARTAAAPGPTSIIKGYQDFREGKLDSPPGLGVEIDQAALARYGAHAG